MLQNQNEISKKVYFNYIEMALKLSYLKKPFYIMTHFIYRVSSVNIPAISWLEITEEDSVGCQTEKFTYLHEVVVYLKKVNVS